MPIKRVITIALVIFLIVVAISYVIWYFLNPAIQFHIYWIISIFIAVLGVFAAIAQFMGYSLRDFDPSLQTSNLTPSRERRDQLILLGKVKKYWINGVLEKSIHAEALIQLGKQSQTQFIEHPWGMVVDSIHDGSRLLPPEKKIIEIFDDIGRNLLILGAPGSGKTISLLELARDLIAVAESDPNQPIPVVFNLSGWNKRDHMLTDWLVNELNRTYRIPSKIGRKWIAANDILPLLDGLDEVNAEQRDDCMKAINTYLQENNLVGLAVCCRVEDYKTAKVKLKLDEAILLQPLTDEQVKEYLAKVGGTKFQLFYEAIQRDKALYTLSQSPLMLSMMIVAYADMTSDEIEDKKPATLDARRKDLFKSYVEHMFNRPTRTHKLIYPKKKVIKWLSFIAKNMKENFQTTSFHTNQISRVWLQERVQKDFVRIVSLLVCGTLFALPFLLFAGVDRGLSTLLIAVSITTLFFFLEFPIPGPALSWLNKNDFQVGFGYDRGLLEKILVFVGRLMGFCLFLLLGLFGLIIGKRRFDKFGDKVLSLFFTLLIFPLKLTSRLVFLAENIFCRLLLYLDSRFPFEVARYFSVCVDLIFLHKVGGGHIFIHQSLLEYFAELYDPNQIGPTEMLARSIRRLLENVFSIIVSWLKGTLSGRLVFFTGVVSGVLTALFIYATLSQADTFLIGVEKSIAWGVVTFLIVMLPYLSKYIFQQLKSMSRPQAELYGLPVMPNAIAGETGKPYNAYIFKASTKDALRYYKETLPRYGWKFVEYIPLENVKEFCVFRNEDGKGYSIHLGSSIGHILIYERGEFTQVDIIHHAY